MENMIEHVVKALKADPIKIRELNFYKKGDFSIAGQPLTYFNLNNIISDLVQSSDYVNRKAEEALFNKQNRWKKRGISLTPIKWGYILNK
jgi:xanthine dehydrogenase/oxidase